MIKECKYCGIKFQSNGKKKYHSARCKKQYENSLRSAPDMRGEQGTLWNYSETICKPLELKGEAAEYWDKIGPTLISRGHLNVLSEHAFAELCDVHARLLDINRALNEASVQASGNGDKKKDNRAEALYKYVAGKGTRESVLSELKRNYSKLELERSKEFYLTPKANHGNFGLSDGDGKQEQTDGIFD